MKDVLGQAIFDHYHKTAAGKLWVHYDLGSNARHQKPKEEMPVKIYFRSAEDMPELEWTALHHCTGKVLDIGAGAGSHALLLQEMGLDTTALDISPLAAKVIKARGVKKVLNEDFFLLPARTKYDTLLLLMNGIGLAATLAGLHTFLQKARTLLKPGGSLIFDSSNIAYLYKGKPPKSKEYYGELLYQYEYRRIRTDWFKWLFIDRRTLRRIVRKSGWKMEILYEDRSDQYLVKCTIDNSLS